MDKPIFTFPNVVKEIDNCSLPVQLIKDHRPHSIFALLLVTMKTPIKTNAMATPLRNPKASIPIIAAAMVATMG